MPRFSIITINLNNAAGLLKTLESVFCQDTSDYELIIIDGGSTDGSVDLVKEHRNKIAYFVSEADEGIYNAQNKGIAHAKGDYLFFLNSGDCLFGPTVLSAFSKKEMEADILYGNIRMVREGGVFIDGKMPEKLSWWHFMKSTLWHQASFISKGLFNRHGGYDEQYKIVGDFDFFLNVLFNGKAKTMYAPVIVSEFKIGGISTSLENEKKHEKERSLSIRRRLGLFSMLVSMMYRKWRRSSLYYRLINTMRA